MLLVIVLLLFLGAVPVHAESSISHAWGKTDLAFEPNRGQTDPGVDFLSRANGYGLFLTAGDAVFRFTSPQPSVVRMKLAGHQTPAKSEGVVLLPGTANYIRGNLTNIPTYRKVRYSEIYPGIDLVYYGNQRLLEYDFVVKPHRDPAQIRLVFEGIRQMQLDREGQLVLQSDANENIYLKRPRVYQSVDGREQDIESSYVINDGEVGFRIGDYDNTKPLLIDPIIVYGSYFGGAVSGTTGDVGNAIAVDAAGNAYITGQTSAVNFPVASARQAALGGNLDAFVMKLDPTGTKILFSTYIGGSGIDEGHSIAVDGSGNIVVTGFTTSSNFPTANAVQTARSGEQDAYVLKLNSTGSSLIYSTYLGGSGEDRGYGVALDSAGNAYVTGTTGSTNFPLVNAYQKSNGGGLEDVFVTKLSPTGSIVYSTYVGGRGRDLAYSIAVDAGGNAFVTGLTTSNNFPVANAFQKENLIPQADDCFLFKLSPGGDALVFSTYFGGFGNDQAVRLVLDVEGNPVITGATSSPNLPVVNAVEPGPLGGLDAFVTKFKADGSGLIFSTYIGGLGNESGSALAVDKEGNVYVAGFTTSFDFPVINAVQGSLSGERDAFLVKLTADGGTFLYSSYFGGSGIDGALGIAVDASSNLYVTGFTTSTDFPIASAFQPDNAGGQDGFVAKINANDIVASSQFQVTNQGATSFLSGGRSTNNALFGYATAEPARPGAPLAGLEILELRRSDVTTTEVGVPAPPLTQLGRFHVEVDSNTRSVISIANPTEGPITVDFFFTDTEGNSNKFWTETIAPGNHFSRFVTDTPFSLASGTSGTLSFGTSVPVAATAFRTFQSERSDFLISGTPIADPSQFTTDVSIVPQFADGASWDSKIVLVNTSEDPMHGEVRFVNQAGTPVDVSIGDSATSVVEYDIPPRTSRKIETKGAPLRSEIPFTAPGGFSFKTAGTNANQLSGNVIADATVAQTPIGIIEYRQNGITRSQAAVIPPRLRTAGRFFVETSAQVKSVISLVNPNDDDASVGVFFTDRAGVSSGSATITIPGHAGFSNFVTESPISVPTDSKGTLTFSSTVPLAATAMRNVTNERNDFIQTAIPIADVNQTTGNTVVIPHYVDGAGWTTQVVLVNPTENEITGELRFRAQNGAVGSVVPYDIAARSFTTIDTEGEANARAGSIHVVPNPGNRTPHAHAVLKLSDGEATVSQASIEAQQPATNLRLYAEAIGQFEARKGGSTQTAIALANPSAAPVTVQFTLAGLDGRSLGESSPVQIPANGQVAMFVNQIPGFEGIKQPMRGTLRAVVTSGAGITGVSLRALINERGSFLATTTGPLNEGRNIIPYISDGAGFSTLVITANVTSPQDNSGILRFFTSDGAGMLLDELRTGTVRVVPFAENFTPSAHVVLSQHHLATTVFQTVVEAQKPARTFRFYVEESGNFEGNQAGSIRNTLTFANVSAQAPAEVRIELFMLNGTSTGRTATLVVPAGGQVSTFVHLLPGFELLAPYKGIIRATSSNPSLLAVGMRALLNERSEPLLTTTGPIVENAGTPNLLVFPHIAEGGGYTTQLVILSGLTGQSSTGVLRFINEKGQPLNLTLR